MSYPRVSITWLGTATHSQWTPAHAIGKLGLSKIETIGFLVNEDKTVVRVAASLSDDGDASDVTVICKGVIIARKKLK